MCNNKRINISHSINIDEFQLPQSKFFCKFNMAIRIIDDDDIINVDDTGVPVHQFSGMSINEFAFFSQDEPIDDYFDYLKQDIDDEKSEQIIIIDDDIIKDDSSN